MIRARPYEWIHMGVRGSGRLGRARVSGTLYITPHRVAVQGRDGPAWSGGIRDIAVRRDGKSGTACVLLTNDGRRIARWKAKGTPAAWWGNAILYWKRGVVQGMQGTDGPPPAFGDVSELPDAIRGGPWRIRRYCAEELAAEGIPGDMPPDGDGEFRRVSRNTNVILAALRHDGFPNGPPPAHYKMMLRRHALTHATGLVWGWKSALQYILDVIRGRGHLARGDQHFRVFASWPDRWYEPKPYGTAKREWYHEVNPASCGGHPYGVLERCRKMIPIMVRVADEMHAYGGHNPYLRMRQVYEAVREGRDPPPPPREALPLARRAAGDPW